MPTPLRSESTAATAPWSVFESRSIAARASSSGVTLAASRSMISAAVFTGERGYSTRSAGRRLLARAGVGEPRGAGRREGLEAAGEERRGHPREDVAAARRRQPRRRDRVDGDALAVGDDRVVALQHADG